MTHLSRVGCDAGAVAVGAEGHLRVGRDGGVVTVVLDRPERKNALLPTMWVDLTEVLREVAARDDDRVLVLTGAGGDFCSGADVGVKLGRGPGMMTRGAVMAAVKACVLALHELPLPTIAAVDGVAVGGGCNLALACDFVVATERARFSQIFVQRGLAVDTGGSWLLPRLVGLAEATRLVLLGDVVDAAAARDLGLVSHVVAPEALEETVHGIAARLLSLPAPALAASKRLVHGAAGRTLSEALDAEAAAQGEMVRSPHLAELLQVFADRPSRR